MRISDWSSDVCSSDLEVIDVVARAAGQGDGDAAVAPHRVVRGAALENQASIGGREVVGRGGAVGERKTVSVDNDRHEARAHNLTNVGVRPATLRRPAKTDRQSAV